MIPLTIEDLHAYLAGQELPVEIQKETNQVFMVFKIAGREFPLFMRIYEGNELLQLIAFIPCTIKPEAVAHLGRLLHMLNKELDIPGFCMDENAGVVFYRAMLPALDKQVAWDHLQRYIRSIESICQNFAPVIATVAFGATTFEEVLKKIATQRKKEPGHKR
jgi:hypothetical protein